VELCTRLTIEKCLLIKLVQKVGSMVKRFFDQKCYLNVIGRTCINMNCISDQFQQNKCSNIDCESSASDFSGLITQTTFACSNIDCESSVSDFTCPDHSNNLCMFQHRQ
jgi:hypothetical protein